MFDSLTDLAVAQRWREQQYPVASVLAIIRREENPENDGGSLRYLLIQRQVEPYTGKWGLVGGRWEFGETLESAVTREVEEETGLKTTFVGLRGVIDERIAPRGEDDQGAHFLLFVCEVAAHSGLAQEQEEGPVAWFSAEEIAELGAHQGIIASDHAILNAFRGSDGPMPYIEAEVMASGGKDGEDELVSFE